MKTIALINIILGGIFFLCFAYQIVYLFVAIFKKEKPHKEAIMHRFAVLIAARNEATVIGGLIRSIRAQSYPSEWMDIYVIADNCTDETAHIAQNEGAFVIERCNRERIGKGYALDYGLKRIAEGKGLDAYDAFVVFDADNLLKADCIEQMNRTYSDGYEVVTCYRNSKNYGDNWISAGYSLWFIKESKFNNYPRMLLGASSVVSGTGFLFSRKIVDRYNGWPFHLLSEDTQFTAQNMLDREKIGYANDAEIYDEHPTQFKQSCKQRMRWSKGFLQILFGMGGKLLCSSFKKGGFPCYDLIMSIAPAMILGCVCLLLNLVALVIGLCTGQEVTPVVTAMILALVNGYLGLFALGALTAIVERKRIHCTTGKKIFYCFTFPFFMLTFLPITLVAIFKKVGWSPIAHSRNRTVEQVVGDGKPKKHLPAKERQ